MADWQPIETAPRDQQTIIAHDPVAGTRLVFWSFAEWYCHETRSSLAPTHWQPLPAPPSEGEVR